MLFKAYSQVIQGVGKRDLNKWIDSKNYKANCKKLTVVNLGRVYQCYL